jgi:hypothetical protein
VKALFCLVAFTVFALANCGKDGSVEGPPLPEGNDTTTTAGQGHPKTCKPTCKTASDCGQSGEALQDASHFACEAGRCTWLGCKSTSECASALHTSDVTCATTPGQDVPICVATCQSPADCAVAGNTLGDASHFACEAGQCRWTGCKSTSECAAALGTTKTTCGKPSGEATPICLPTCQKAADCAIPGTPMNDAGHFACKAGKCEWLGCKSTAECSAALHLANVVCE